MVLIDNEKCTTCGNCVIDCPVGALKIEQDTLLVSNKCVHCGVCMRVCRYEAVSLPSDLPETAITCTSCPIRCAIQPGYFGACRRYLNIRGSLVRDREPVLDPPLTSRTNPAINQPLITAVGAGTTYPCCRPAPSIVHDSVDGIDVVTVVTEAPLSYSGVKLKVDTNFFIGDEGAKVRRQGRVIGMIETEEYGSKMIAIGGANRLTGRNGFLAARTVAEICNGEPVELKVDGGVELSLQVGKKPVIDGIEDSKMRVGCGSATIGMFAESLAAVVDEAIILDHHVVGLLSEHPAGDYINLKWSGITPRARKSTRGRYFGEHGSGWGGTNIKQPREAIMAVDQTTAVPGIKILVTETTGQDAALFTLDNDFEIRAIPLTVEVRDTVKLISDSCQEARVSAIYTGGTGGSARAGVTKYPVKLTEAIHNGEATLTIGGAPTYILPGGGINFLVDVEKVVPRSFTWVPTPATVAPVEYTVTRQKYSEMGGHIDHMIKLSAIKNKKKN